MRRATPCPDREASETRVDSPETGNITVTNSNLNVQENLGELSLIWKTNEENLVRFPMKYKFRHRLLNGKILKE